MTPVNMKWAREIFLMIVLLALVVLMIELNQRRKEVRGRTYFKGLVIILPIV